MRKRQKKNRKRIALFRTLGCVLLIGCFGIGLYALNLIKSNAQKDDESKEVYDNIKKEVEVREDTGEESTTEKSEKSKKTQKNTDVIDWDALGGHDVVGWIKIDDIADYPVVKGDDNEYYLTHLYDGTYNYNGSIFVSCENNKDFMDLNTIIYGHNMGYTGQMFGKVKQLLDESIKDPKIYIYTPDGMKHTYDVYSIDHVKDLGYAYKTQFGTLKAFAEYKDEVKANSARDFGVEKDNSKTIMISTCDSYGSQDGNRLVVIAQESSVKKVSEPASWYEKANYIELNNKKAACLKGNSSYYIVQDGLAVRCRKDIVTKLVPPGDEAIVRVEYEPTNEGYEYVDNAGNSTIYQIVDIIDYITE